MRSQQANAEKWIEIGIVISIMFILNMPSSVIEVTSIYSIRSVVFSTGYLMFEYSFSFLFLPFIFLGLILYSRSKCVRFMPVYFCIVLINIFRYLLKLSNPIDLRSYEMFLSILSGLSIASILCFYYRTSYNMTLLMDYFIYINFFTQVFFWVTGRASGRIEVMSMSYGDLGLMCSTYLLIFLCCRKKTKMTRFPLIACIISLVLSGSRTNILFLIICIFFFLPQITKGIELDRKKKKVILAIFYFLLVFVFIVIVTGNLWQSNTLFFNINRLLSLFSSGFFLLSVKSDASFIERIQSLVAGLRILQQNHFGISNSYVDLHLQTEANGFKYFPHSNLLSYYLMWGIPGLAVYVSMIKRFFIAKKNKNTISVPLAFFIIVSIFYGGPTCSTKMYVWLFLIFSYFNVLLKESKA